jgi:hypothetical protein
MPMGIDTHALNFLKYASQKKVLGGVATLGRQQLMVPRAFVEFGMFCEEYLQSQFGAKFVDSYDFSGFEGATHLVDMNKPMAAGNSYDTVIDCGCTEHIFNVSQALKNISQLCSNGGRSFMFYQRIISAVTDFGNFPPNCFSRFIRRSTDMPKQKFF